MKILGNFWKKQVALALDEVRLAQSSLRERTDKESDEQATDVRTIVLNKPPNLSKGDLAFPMFSYAKQYALSPAELAQGVGEVMKKRALHVGAGINTIIEASGPFVNVFVDRAHIMPLITSTCIDEAAHYGKSNVLQGQKIMVEFSAPNTNKPLHLGHLRNDALGESISRILEYGGAEVCKVNLINDRGVHICQSMLAYQKFGNNETPESRAMKPDHFVGEYYVRYAQWEKAYEQKHKEERNPSPFEEAQQMLVKWEAQDPEVMALWKKLNTWALDGIFHTYKDTEVSFDKVYFESKTYMLGKDMILKGLEDGVFTKESDGTISVSLEKIGLDKKVLLRSDGTSVYITQDLGTAQHRYNEWAFDKMIFVVAHEQNYHFQVLFHILSLLQFKPAEEGKMYHLGYGMVHLPEGRMKSREGNVVDADSLLSNIASLVQQEMKTRNPDRNKEEMAALSKKVALGAIHYYLLSTNFKKDVTFSPESSIQFQGNTGPYLQYTGARITSILSKFSLPEREPHWNETCSDVEWELVLLIDTFPTVLVQTSEKYDPSFLAHYLYELSSSFSRFYQNMPIATAESEGVQMARMTITKAVLQVLKNGMHLLNIPYISYM